MSIPCTCTKGHCYAVAMNKAAGKPVFSLQCCPACEAHLAPSGICLNACHLKPETREKFGALMGKIVKSME